MTAGARLPRHKGFEVVRPPDVSDAHWQAALRGLQSFVAAGWVEKAEAAGWTRDELFAAPPQWARVDLCGAALLVGDHEVVAVTPNEIRVKTASGATQAFYHPPDFALAFNSLRKQLEGNVGREEARLRARDATISEYRRLYGADLEVAKRAVDDIIAGEGKTP